MPPSPSQGIKAVLCVLVWGGCLFGGFEKGHTHAVGRPKGSPIKSSTKVRELSKDLILEKYEQLKYNLGELQTLDRIKMIIELSKFVFQLLKQYTEMIYYIVNDLNRDM